MASGDTKGGNVVSDGVTPGKSSVEGHHRTPSSSTVSTSTGSLGTEKILDWWEAHSPWAWQWSADAGGCELGQGNDEEMVLSQDAIEAILSVVE